MIDQTNAPLARLQTVFGTLVYVEAASGEVRHGAIDNSRANAVLMADQALNEAPRNAWLKYEHEGILQPIACSESGCWCPRVSEISGASVAPHPFKIVRLDRGLIALRSGGLYLCAEDDGRVTLSRTRCAPWEFFIPSEAWCSASVANDETRDDPVLTATIDWPAVEKFRSSRSHVPAPEPRMGADAVPANGRFARRRVIVMRHRGNLANKMLQYMGALTLANRIKGCTIVNVSIPEWGIQIADDTHDDVFFDEIDLLTWDPFRPHVEELCSIANNSSSIRIMLGDHLLRMEFLSHPRFYDTVFPKGPQSSHQVSEADLVINIRTAEILGGVPHYPLLPISFYEDIVARTGLNPVFVGQLDQSEYVRRLKQCFPLARFIDSEGARADFELIRSAKNILVAVSTFSWLAAWFSEAKTIILPLSGFYNPAHHREVDLLPVDDVRYRFFLFPLNYGLPEKDSMEYHERIKGHWKEISRNYVALLKSASPFLRVPRENYDNGLPTRVARGAAITFDSVWYAHQYLVAAMEISEGLFEDPLHHYLEVGRLRGYLPTRPMGEDTAFDITLPNLALKKPATQSSLCEWSNGATPEEDAANAVNGDLSKEDGFHTAYESAPWWMVDLGGVASIRFMRIFNRDSVPEWMQLRASPLLVEVSSDGDKWSTLFCTCSGQLFGGHKGGRPLIWSSKRPVEARFVRVSIPRQEYLHLAEVEVYGLFQPSGIS